MAEHKYQWSLFVDSNKNEQFVIRCDDPVEFLAAMELVKGLLSQQQSTTAGASEPETPPDQCTLHNVTMKQRQSKTGGHWYDHRWQEGDVWHICNGKTVRTP